VNVNITHLRQVARSLNIPAPSATVITEILRREGITLRHLEGASNGDHHDDARIRGVFLACHESTTERLQRGKLPLPSIEALIAIGQAEGAKFGLEVKAWEAVGFPDNEASSYIRSTLARFAEQKALPLMPDQAAEHVRRRAIPRSPSFPHALSYRPGRGAPTRIQDVEQSPAVTDHSPPRPGLAASSRVSRTSCKTGSELQPPDPHVADDEAPKSAQQTPRARGHDVTSGHRGDALSDRVVEDVSAHDRTFVSQHIYGGRAAVCISADQTRANVHTVRVEAAESISTRQYDWRHKIAVQLSQRELPLVLAVFMGWIQKFEGKGHGENNSKWFTIENQGNKLFLSVCAKGQTPRAIPILPGDSYAATALLLGQLLKNDPRLPPELLLSLVRKEAALVNGKAVASSCAA
jgi:hypothetical protein